VLTGSCWHAWRLLLANWSCRGGCRHETASDESEDDDRAYRDEEGQRPRCECIGAGENVVSGGKRPCGIRQEMTAPEPGITGKAATSCFPWVTMAQVLQSTSANRFSRDSRAAVQRFPVGQASVSHSCRNPHGLLVAMRQRVSRNWADSRCESPSLLPTDSQSCDARCATSSATQQEARGRCR
jgi:hypothetical protein